MSFQEKAAVVFGKVHQLLILRSVEARDLAVAEIEVALKAERVRTLNEVIDLTQKELDSETKWAKKYKEEGAAEAFREARGGASSARDLRFSFQELLTKEEAP